MAQVIDKQIIDAIDSLSVKQKKAVLGVIRAFANEVENGDHWKDDGFVKEMERRYKDYKTGKSKLVNLDDVEERARNTAQKLRNEKAPH